MNILPRPLQCFLLIKEPNIQIAILSYLLTGQKSERADTIIDLNKNHAEIRFGDDLRSIKVPVRIRSITAALNEKPDW